MPKHEQHAVDRNAEALGPDAFPGGRSPQGAPHSLRGNAAKAGNVIHMDRKRDERQGQPDASDKGETVGDEAALSHADRARMADQIGRQLRGMYDGLLSQPVPDRFMELVKRLERGDVKGEDKK